MIDRKVIEFAQNLEIQTQVSKKSGSYYLPNNNYVTCNLDPALLPIKLNLPMVYRPIDWACSTGVPHNLSDLSGGYLSGPTGDIYDRFRLLSTSDNHHFDIKLTHNMMNIKNYFV